MVIDQSCRKGFSPLKTIPSSSGEAAHTVKQLSTAVPGAETPSVNCTVVRLVELVERELYVMRGNRLSVERIGCLWRNEWTKRTKVRNKIHVMAKMCINPPFLHPLIWR